MFQLFKKMQKNCRKKIAEKRAWRRKGLRGALRVLRALSGIDPRRPLR